MSTRQQRDQFVAALQRDGNDLDFGAFTEARGMSEADADEFAREVLAVVAARRARNVVRERKALKRINKIAKSWKVQGDAFELVDSYAETRLLPRFEERAKSDRVITPEERREIDALREVLGEPRRDTGNSTRLTISSAELWFIRLGPLVYWLVEFLLLWIAAAIGNATLALIAGWTAVAVGIGLFWYSVRRVELMDQLKYCWKCRRTNREWRCKLVEDSEGNVTEVRTCPECKSRSPRTGWFAGFARLGYMPVIVITIVVLFIAHFGE